MLQGLQMRVIAVVALGGSLGSLARYSVASAMDRNQVTDLAATLMVNLLGALAIGIAYPWIRSARRSPLWQPFLITGILGGFTTFSTMAADVVLNRQAPWLVLGYLGSTLIFGLLAVPTGQRIFARFGGTA